MLLAHVCMTALAWLRSGDCHHVYDMFQRMDAKCQCDTARVQTRGVGTCKAGGAGATAAATRGPSSVKVAVVLVLRRHWRVCLQKAEWYAADATLTSEAEMH